jgi:hypothetical protein
MLDRHTDHSRRNGMRSIISLLSGLTVGLAAGMASAQDAKGPGRQLVPCVQRELSNVNTAADGTRSELFGPDPKGQAMFGSDGRYSIMFHRAEMPKIAANNRVHGTAEENKAIVGGMITLYGRYTVADKVLVMTVEGSSYPNWVGTEQCRPISYFTADEMRIVNMGGSAGGRNDLVLKRIGQPTAAQ